MAKAISTRLVTPEDYSLLCQWWADWKWDPVPIDFLPGNCSSGLVVEVNNTPVAAGFFYTTNSAVSWVDWVISDKNYRDHKTRDGSLMILMRGLIEMAKNSGSKYIYALLKSDKLISKYESLGFIRGDSYNQEMIKIL